MSKIFDQLKHFAYDEVPGTTTPQQAAVIPAAIVPEAVPIVASSVVDSPAIPDDDVYQKILSKTDFDKSEVGQAIQKFSKPLEGIIPDEALRIRTAVATAAAQGSVTIDGVMGTFVHLRQSLVTLEANLKSKAALFEHDQITLRQNRLAEIQKQLSDLQAEQAQTIKDLSDAQSRAAQTTTSFKVALERRARELDQQKAHYAQLLQG